MRDTVIALNGLYGAQKNRELTVWLNEQFARQGSFEGGSVSLSDIKEESIINAILEADAELSLTVDQLIRHVMVVPALSKNHQTFEPVIRFKSGFFKSLLHYGKQIKIDAVEAVRLGDKFERYGNDKHVFHQQAANNHDAQVLMVYLNGTIKGTEQEFSVVLNEKEVAAIKTEMIDKFYNGVDPFTAGEWLDVVFSALFTRMYDEDIFIVLQSILSDSHFELYKKLKAFGVGRFNPHSNGGLKVYSSYGKHIGTKRFAFNAIERKQQESTSPPELKIITGGAGKPKKTETKKHIDEDIMKDFGGF
ncbi:hypothetical protein [Alteromonas gilva]|uniref:Uncharacterized protein n=1 Tax=Alteromonas gilva TaxID=2987522 RepID=A0ABT5L8T4_9ALTE|nr:hypothetical protein [Alteromonas gilva]MDC8832974.1 hypothetical protein [Alteromonas gilva]